MRLKPWLLLVLPGLLAPGAQAQVVKCVNADTKAVTFANHIAQCPPGSSGAQVEVKGAPSSTSTTSATPGYANPQAAPSPWAGNVPGNAAQQGFGPLSAPVLLPPQRPASETAVGDKRIRTTERPVFMVKPPPSTPP